MEVNIAGKGIFVDAVMMPVRELIPYEKNPKQHPPEQIKKIAKSISKFGFDQPIVVNRDKVIIKGHGRRLAALELGLVEVPVVIRSDLSEVEERASRIIDNQAAESYWHMANLIKELETLSTTEKVELEDTGFSLKEINYLMPNLLSKEESVSGVAEEGGVVSTFFSTGAGGAIGDTVKTSLGVVEYLSKVKNIYIPITGDMHSSAVLEFFKQSNLFSDKVHVVDISIGNRQWHSHDDYLEYLEARYDITIEKLPSKLEDWKNSIKELGYPTEQKLWCCNKYKWKSFVETIQDISESAVVLSWNKDSAKKVRKIGKFLENNLIYVAPFATISTDEIVKIVEESGLKLNPIYNKLNMYLCPMCPMYRDTDIAFLKEHDLDLWIRWMIYFGRAQYNKEYISEYLNTEAIKFIANGVEPRAYGRYCTLALPLNEVKQPIRLEIREGDDYGFDPIKDASLSPETRLDKVSNDWWQQEGHSEAFIKQQAEVEKATQERGNMSLSEWMQKKIAEAKEAARQAGLM